MSGNYYGYIRKTKVDGKIPILICNPAVIDNKLLDTKSGLGLPNFTHTKSTMFLMNMLEKINFSTDNLYFDEQYNKFISHFHEHKLDIHYKVLHTYFILG